MIGSLDGLPVMPDHIFPVHFEPRKSNGRRRIIRELGLCMLRLPDLKLACNSAFEGRLAWVCSLGVWGAGSHLKGGQAGRPAGAVALLPSRADTT